MYRAQAKEKKGTKRKTKKAKRQNNKCEYFKSANKQYRSYLFFGRNPLNQNQNTLMYRAQAKQKRQNKKRQNNKCEYLRAQINSIDLISSLVKPIESESEYTNNISLMIWQGN